MIKGMALRTWIDIDAKAVAHNVSAFRKLIGKKVQLCAVAKSNAYGHSLIDLAKEFERNKVDMIAVDSIVEAVHLREAGIKARMIVLGATLPLNFRFAKKHDIAVAISTIEGLREAGKQGIAVHLKIDTGMHRQGFQLHEVDALCNELGRKKYKVDGVFTHFASAKNPSFPGDTHRQMEQFDVVCEKVKAAGYAPLRHASASGGTLLFPEAHYDMVRVGISLYGLWPSEETERACASKVTLRPVLSWKAVVSEVKTVKKGERVGYDGTEILSRDSVLAVVPIGYWHGYPRALSSVGRVLLRGGEGRVVGRVSMDMISVDVTDVGPVKVGDTVELLGGTGAISADAVARLAGTSSYEMVTRINPLIQRIVKR